MGFLADPWCFKFCLTAFPTLCMNKPTKCSVELLQFLNFNASFSYKNHWRSRMLRNRWQCTPQSGCSKDPMSAMRSWIFTASSALLSVLSTDTQWKHLLLIWRDAARKWNINIIDDFIILLFNILLQLEITQYVLLIFMLSETFCEQQQSSICSKCFFSLYLLTF